jgi:chromate transporter
LKLGLTSFGGPIAHLGYFHEEYVRRRKWLDESRYADLVALCQFLPGPASSQVGIGIGIMRGGILGGLIAWLGFTLPSIVALLLFATLFSTGAIADAGWVHGLKLVAVAIVAQAVLGMGQKLASDRTRATIAVVTAALVLLVPSAVMQLGVIVAAGVVGVAIYRQKVPQLTDKPLVSGGVDTSAVSDEMGKPLVSKVADEPPLSKRAGVIGLSLFFAGLVLLPIMSGVTGGYLWAIADGFYRAGALVFGGGHVVLPMLERVVVPTGWVNEQQFLAGYGATQAVPGPLFTFASYLGAISGGVWIGLFATLAIFLPAFLLVVGALPFWHMIRVNPNMQGALKAINAAVVGLLVAALYSPVWTSAVKGVEDFGVVAVLFVLLVFWKLPPWVIVLIGALGGSLLELFM